MKNWTVRMMFVVLFALTVCMSNSNANANTNQPQVYKLIFSSVMHESEFTSHPAATALASFVKNVQEKSGGRIVITLYKGGQLSDNTENDVQGLAGGAFHFANPALASLGSYTNAFIPFNMLYMFANQDAADRFIDSEIANRMRQKALKDMGIRTLAFLDVGFRNLTTSTREIRRPEDIKGLKIRTMEDPFQIKAFQAMGASPTPMAYSELFSALQQGVIDGQENPMSNIIQAKLYEVQKYMTLTRHSFTINTIVMAESAFQKLPADLQQLILDEARAAELMSRANCAQKEASLLEDCKKVLQVYEPTLEELHMFQDAARASWEQAKATMGEDDYNAMLKTVESINSQL